MVGLLAEDAVSSFAIAGKFQTKQGIDDSKPAGLTWLAKKQRRKGSISLVELIQMFDSGAFLRERLRKAVVSSSQILCFEGTTTYHCISSTMRDVASNIAHSIRNSLVPTHDLCHSSRLIRHPSSPSAANATGILLDDRNGHWSHAPTFILGRRNKSFTCPNSMPRLTQGKTHDMQRSPDRFSGQARKTWVHFLVHISLFPHNGATHPQKRRVDGRCLGIPFITSRRRSNVSKPNGVTRCNGTPRKSTTNSCIRCRPPTQI